MAIRASVVCLLAGFACARREGEDYTLELADEVLANNKEALLPSPYEIMKNTPTDRDVGYLGEHPIDSKFQLSIQFGSLQTQREGQGLLPDIAIGRVLTKESKEPPYPPASYRWTGKGGKGIRHLNGLVNPDSEQIVWQWQKNRWFAVKAFLDDLISRPYDRLVAIHSSGDVLYGGCDENTIRYKYDTVISANGGTQSIVLAAEVAPFPVDLGHRYEVTDGLEARRTAALSAVGCSPSWVSAYANCTDLKLGTCGSKPYKYQYANSGFIIGPMSEVYDMLEELDTWPSSENRLVNEYFLKNPDKVALDYAGVLAASLHNLKPGLVEVATEGGKKVLKNKVTGQVVCFVHGNGDSLGTLKALATQLKA